MPCRNVDHGDGRHAIVCGPPARARKCIVCGVSTKEPKLCDFPVGKGKTCDAPMCRACARHTDPDTDFCPRHDDFMKGRLKL